MAKMEIRGITFGFFLTKVLEDPDELYHNFKKELKSLKKTFSLPNIPKIESSIGDFPLIGASSIPDLMNLSISKKKVLIDFNGENKKDLKKFLNQKTSKIKKLIKIIQKIGDIRRIGIIAKIFFQPKDRLDFLKKFLNQNKFAPKKLKEIAIKLHFIEEIGNIECNNLIHFVPMDKAKKKITTKGIGLNIDINNMNKKILKRNELDFFIENIQNKIIKLVKENIE